MESTNPITLEQYPESRIAQLGVWYPRCEENIDTIQVSLYDVRASDGFRFKYDFDRDGWSILQPDEEGEWEETHFVQSWARDKEMQGENTEEALRAISPTPEDKTTCCIATGRDEFTLTPPVLP